MPETVLVVEDEPDIAQVLEHVLGSEGYEVRVAPDGRSALEMVRHRKPDVVLLDLMLPEMPGLEVLKAIRSAAATRLVPVMLLTARRDEVDRVLGFELGADDYITKPFSPRELVLRMRALLKRTRGPADSDTSGLLRAGPVEVDLEAHHVRVEGELVLLTITEFRLLVDLMQAHGRVRTRETLLAKVWNYDSEVLSRTVDTHVRRLRSKLGPAAEWIETIRGVGYRLRDPSTA